MLRLTYVPLNCVFYASKIANEFLSEMVLDLLIFGKKTQISSGKIIFLARFARIFLKSDLFQRFSNTLMRFGP